MSEHTEVTYRGVRLLYYPTSDQWGPCETASPIPMGTMAAVRASIDQWECQKQVLSGVKVWDLSHSDPKWWSQKDAVFRSDGQTHYVITRNFRDNPDSLYNIARCDTAMVTEVVAAAIALAETAHKEAVAANERWRKSRFAIPCMTNEDWLKLQSRAT